MQAHQGDLFAQDQFESGPDGPDASSEEWMEYEEEILPEDDSGYVSEALATYDVPAHAAREDGGAVYPTLAAAVAALPSDPRVADLFEGLNDRQASAATALLGPVMVVAGPGSGKTRVLTHRVAALVRLGVPAWQVMAVTFTNKAAAEMRERISDLVGAEEASQMWVSTFHSACARLLRQYSEAVGLPRSFSILDSSDVQRVLKSILSDAGSPAEASAVKEIASAISKAKNAGRTAEELLDSIKPSDRADGHLMSLYNQRLNEMGSVDFDDLLCMAVQLLRTHEPARDWIRKRARFLLVDEVQDTNSVQMDLLRLICPPSEGLTAAEGPSTLSEYLRSSRGNICVVGDFDQCHPAGTMVETTKGPVAVEDLDPEAHRLVSWDVTARGTKDALRGVSDPDRPNGKAAGYRFVKGVRPYSGEMVTLTTPEESVEVTPNHRVYTRWRRDVWEDPQRTVLYLMRRGGWWRVGTCFLHRQDGAGFGPSFRARQEKADAVWILDVFDTPSAAQVAEKIVAANFGLPQTTFEPTHRSPAAEAVYRSRVPGGSDNYRTTIAAIFAGVEGMEDKALRLLARYGRHVDHPFWMPPTDDGTRERRGGSAYTRVTAAANVIGDLMEVPTRSGLRNVVWVPVSASRRPFAGSVYSLEVDRYHNYVANGIVVRNCVYGWRGADPAGMAGFTSEYQGAQVVVLEQNYRSTKAILEVVQSIIDPNPAVHRPRLFTENDRGEPVRLYVAEDDRDEAEWVVSQIRRSTSPLDAHAVLFRTNAQTRVFEEQLTKSALPYQVVGALRFYDRAEIKDALSYLRLVANPQDLVALGRCINTPKRGIGEASVSALVTLARSRGEDPITTLRSALPAGELPGRARTGFTNFLIAYDAIRAAAQDGPAAGLRAVADDAGLRTALAADKESGLDRIENLDELIGGAEAFVAGASPTSPEGASVSDLSGWEQTLAFLENVSLVSSSDTEEVVTPKVSLLTAHASKGKEFPHVYVVGIEDGLYPHERSKDSEAGIEEERRLLFVATSRAEKTLALSRALTRFVYNKPQENRASPFLADLPESVVTVPARKRRPSAPSWNQQSRHPYGGRSGSYPSRGGRPGGSTQPSGSAPAPRPLAPAKPKPAPGPRLTPAEVSSGALVAHGVFGEGQVLSVDGTKVTVRFGAQEKVLDLAFAPLSLVQS